MSTLSDTLGPTSRAPRWLGLVLALAAVAFIVTSVIRTGAEPTPPRTGDASPSTTYPAGGRDDYHDGLGERGPARHDGVRGHPVRRG